MINKIGIVKVLLFVVLSFCCIEISYAQNVTLDELLRLRTKTTIDIEEYLSNKGWEYVGIQPSDNESYKDVLASLNPTKLFGLNDYKVDPANWVEAIEKREREDRSGLCLHIIRNTIGQSRGFTVFITKIG